MKEADEVKQANEASGSTGGTGDARPLPAAQVILTEIAGDAKKSAADIVADSLAALGESQERVKAAQHDLDAAREERAKAVKALQAQLQAPSVDGEALRSAVLNDDALLLAVGELEELDPKGYLRLKDAFLKAGAKARALDALLKLADETWTKWEAAHPVEPPGPMKLDGRPSISVTDQLDSVLDKARAALVKANAPPSLFVKSGVLVRVKDTGLGFAVVEHTVGSLREALSRAARWTEDEAHESDEMFGMDEPRVSDKPVYPPAEVVAAILATPPELAQLESVASCPFFDADGVLVLEDGYHPTSRTYLKLDPTLKGIVIAQVPATKEVVAAVALLDELVCDFKWAHPTADKAHFFALLLERFVRHMIEGTTPMHFLEAPEPGSGKTLLGDIAATIATGETLPWRQWSKQEEEREKSMMSVLRAGAAFVGFDNAKGELASPTIEAALTARVVRGRILGRSEDATMRNLASWCTTINNGEPTPDLARRGVRSRINPQMENPAERTEFTHPDLIGWTRESRAALVGALLTLVQNWLTKGRPPFSGKPLASFESWSRIVGGILESAGIQGFLDPSAKVVSVDPRKEEVVLFLEAWNKWRPDEDVRASELLDGLVAPEAVNSHGDTYRQAIHLKSTFTRSPNSWAQQLGQWLHRQIDRTHGHYRVEKGQEDAHAKVARYKVVYVGPPPEPPPVPNNNPQRAASHRPKPSVNHVPPPPSSEEIARAVAQAQANATRMGAGTAAESPQSNVSDYQDFSGDCGE